ncbi:MAG: hypothetical protein WAQ22_04250 [Candidatus Saccharimonas sp.]
MDNTGLFQAVCTKGPSWEELTDAFSHIYDVPAKTVSFTMRVEALGSNDIEVSALVKGMVHEERGLRLVLISKSKEWGVCEGIYDPRGHTGSFVANVPQRTLA